MKINLDITKAAKTDVKIPMIKVVANDSIGPVPNTLSTIAVKRVVTFASIIDDNAFWKPVSIACFNSLPLACSSRIRSNIRTFASTDIPIVSTIPAIPGSVSTAPKEESTPKMKINEKIRNVLSGRNEGSPTSTRK